MDDRTPESLDEAIAALKNSWSAEDLDRLKGYSNEDIAAIHFSTGMDLRNSWSLWGNNPLTEDLKRRGCSHPDDMSYYILVQFQRHLNGHPLQTVD